MIRDSLFFPFTPALRYFDLVTRSSGKWNNALSKERWPVRTDKL